MAGKGGVGTPLRHKAAGRPEPGRDLLGLVVVAREARELGTRRRGGQRAEARARAGTSQGARGRQQTGGTPIPASSGQERPGWWSEGCAVWKKGL